MKTPRIVLTVSAGTLAGLAEALPELTLQEAPLLSFAPPHEWAPVDRALEELEKFRAVAFSSPRAAGAVARRALRQGRFFDDAMPVWVTGAATAAALRGICRLPRFSRVGAADMGAGEALAREMIAAGTRSPVLYPCGELHRVREELPAILRSAGLTVHPVTCYRALLAGADDARSALEGADVVVVGSPRVANLLAGVARSGSRPALLALGPVTGAAARAAGWPPDAEAARPSVDAVAASLRQLTARVFAE